MGADTFRSGDRVRVTFEATVEYKKAFGGFVFKPVNGGNLVSLEDTADLSIQKIEPPFEVFGPGDRVRHKNIPDYQYTIGHGGYFDHVNNLWNVSKTKFTSETYERVELHEAPF